MSRLRKWWKHALVLMAAVATLQVGVSLLVRTHGVHAFLTRHLQRAFGRPVEVGQFNLLLLPSPQLDAYRVTIGEDPAFGSEYFLRTEHLTAVLRWTGLLKGHVEFGTLSMSRPRLTLVRNSEGRWNLERWLPPAKTSARTYGPPLITPANRLSRIDIDDGRINFKLVDEKLPFAFVNVSGSVEQVSPGRWQLRLSADPWRSGASLQSAGTLVVQGDVAGTSARLQPAEIHVHWEQGSLADLVRLFRGRDYGVRGLFSLDATATTVTSDPTVARTLQTGDWLYSIQARAGQIHRWDLTERSDNPRVNARVLGKLNFVTGEVHATRVVLETTRSNLRGTADAIISTSPVWEIRVDSAGVQASDALAWYRAFQPDVEEGVSIEQYFTGAVTIRGWPLQLRDAAFSSLGGEAHIPGLAVPVRIGPVDGGRERDQLTIDPVRVSYSYAGTAHADGTTQPPSKRRTIESRGTVSIGVTHDFAAHTGGLSIDGHVDKIEDALKISAALGRSRNHGWELTGPASASLHWDWGGAPLHAKWNGKVEMGKGELQVAGLNRPLELSKTRVEWKNSVRSADIGEIDGLGGTWSGTISQAAAAEVDGGANWNFQLHGDRLDAAELDRWIGPRARPGWLRRLLPSLLGGTPPLPNTVASELVRRVDAEGELRIDRFTMEKVKLEQVRVLGALQDLHLVVRDASAQWAGGTVHARVDAKFLPRPAYDVIAELDGLNIADLPAPPHVTDRFAGTASGTLHLTTQGVGREELLEHLAGRGDIRVHNVEFHGWDVSASVADGEPRTGHSRWAAGEGAFTLRDRGIVLAGLRLEAGREVTFVKGTVSFGHDADLTVQTATDGKRETRAPEASRVLKILGPLDVPRVSVERVANREPAD